MAARVLLVDDEPQILKALTRALQDEDFEILSAAGGEEALGLIRKESIDVVVSDENMPGMAGGELLSIVCREYPDTIRILLTGQPSFEAVARAVNQGEIYRFLTKPWNDTDLIITIKQALQRRALLSQNRELLQKVREQSITLQELERQNPGITKLQRDEDGAIVVDDVDDLAEIDKYLASFDTDEQG